MISVLPIPEENLEEVISVIRIGMLLILNTKEYDLSDSTIKLLRKWCVEKENYLQKLKDD